MSREKKEGWCWHGVDNSQGLDFSYNADQISSEAHLREVAVMMLVRMGQKSGCEEAERINSKDDQVRNKRAEEGSQYHSKSYPDDHPLIIRS